MTQESNRLALGIPNLRGRFLPVCLGSKYLSSFLHEFQASMEASEEKLKH